MIMDFDVVQLLAIKDVQVIGVLLVGIVVIGGLFLNGRLFTKGQIESERSQCKELKDALAQSVAENKLCAKDYTEARILIARLEEREHMAARSMGRGATT